jgi:hypothetical protein
MLFPRATTKSSAWSPLPPDLGALKQTLRKLRSDSLLVEPEQVKQMLQAIVPEYTPSLKPAIQTLAPIVALDEHRRHAQTL